MHVRVRHRPGASVCGRRVCATFTSDRASSKSCRRDCCSLALSAPDDASWRRALAISSSACARSALSVSMEVWWWRRGEGGELGKHAPRAVRRYLLVLQLLLL